MQVPGEVDNLNNPSIEQNQHMLVDENCDCPMGGPPSDGLDGQEERMVLVIELPAGGNVDLGQLMSMLAGLANDADDSGLTDQADKIDGVMASLKKVAQYEGIINYWVANGRAFEMAWKQKREKSKTKDDVNGNEYNSAQDCWMEVLEEYQDSLLTNQLEFVSKYASKKEVEKADCGSNSTTMSKEMTEFHKNLKEKGKTEGESISDWLESKYPDYKEIKKEAARELEQKIASKIESGSAPGVAVYESIYELVENAKKHNDKAVAHAVVAALEVAEDLGEGYLEKKAVWGGFWDAITSPFKGFVGNQWHKFKDWAGDSAAKFGPSFTLMRAVKRQIPIIIRELQDIEASARTATGVNPAEIASAIESIMSPLTQFRNMVSTVVSLPPIPDPMNERYKSRVVPGVDLTGYTLFIQDLNRLIETVNPNTALTYERSKNKGQQTQGTPQTNPAQQQMKVGPQPEDAKLNKALEQIIRRVNDLAGREVIPINRFNRLINIMMPKELSDSMNNIRESGDFNNFSEVIKDKILDRISRSLDLFVQGPLLQMNPRERMNFLNKKEKLPLEITQEIEKALRSKFDRMYKYRQQTDNPAMPNPGAVQQR